MLQAKLLLSCHCKQGACSLPELHDTPGPVVEHSPVLPSRRQSDASGSEGAAGQENRAASIPTCWPNEHDSKAHAKGLMQLQALVHKWGNRLQSSRHTAELHGSLQLPMLLQCSTHYIHSAWSKGSAAHALLVMGPAQHACRLQQACVATSS